VRKIVMPRMDMDMEEGTVVAWLKAEGENVRKDDPIVTIMSLKVTYEIPSPADGVLVAVIVPRDTDVPVGRVLGIIAEEEDTPESVRSEMEKSREAPRTAQDSVALATHIEKPYRETHRRIIASPLARRLAEEQRLDLSLVTGTGPDGRITREDVLKALEQTTSLAEVKHLTGIRKTVATRMAQSWSTAPHAVLTIDVTASRLVESRRESLSEGTELSVSSYFVWAVARALSEYVALNSTFDGSEIKTWKEVNICVAIDVGEGLVAPVIRHADRKTLKDLTKEINELVDKAKQNKLEARHFKDGTFTITNLGMYGVKTFQPIINPPQAAILAIGSILDHAIPRDSEIRIEPIVALSLAFDHRIIDGAPAAKFLSRVKELLETV